MRFVFAHGHDVLCNGSSARSTGRSPGLLEYLEPRRLLSAAPVIPGGAMTHTITSHSGIITPLSLSIDGTYVGKASFDGSGSVRVAITLSENGGKLSAAIPIRPGITVKPDFETNGFYPTGGGYLAANYNTAAGSGIIQVHNGRLVLDANMNILIDNLQVHIVATRSSATSSAKRTRTVQVGSAHTASVAPRSDNPLIGTFGGKVHVPFIDQTFSYVTTVTQKKGTNKLSLVETLTLGNLGEMDLAYAVDADRNGKFTLNLGSDAAMGTLSGHFNSAGKLITVFAVPGHPTISSSAARR